MKLYFYFLEEQYDKKSHIRIEECEVKEDSLCYILLGKVKGFYDRFIPKSEIGLCSGCVWEYQVILEEPNIEYAKKLLSDYLNNQIDRNQKEIEKLKEKLSEVERM